MNTTEITDAIRNNAMPLVFVNVFLHQLGVPVPAIPTLLIAGSLASSLGFGASLIAVSVSASLLADSIWYAAGRGLGQRVLSVLCRLSINPGSCVTSAQGRFSRWGAWTLVIAKLVPGLSLVGPPIAGSLRMSVLAFVMASALGGGLWAAVPIVVGWILRAKVQIALDAVSGHLSLGLFTTILALGAWLAWLLWRRRRVDAHSATARVTVDDLESMMASDTPPLVLDLRSALVTPSTEQLPGAFRTTIDQLPAAIAHWPLDRSVVIVCACPQGSTAERAARILTTCGYESARPLEGGHGALNERFRRHAAAVTGGRPLAP
jgi:membrane protein DedA with SNARE-associated domain/rhodanese-related sulfurtransferase